MKQRFFSWVCIVIIIVGIGISTFSSTSGSPETQLDPTQSTVFIEAFNPDANVRAAPTIEGEWLGFIQPGESYAVIGKRFEWLLIHYPPAPSRYGWVHHSIVQVSGDLNTVPEVDPAYIRPAQASLIPSTTSIPTGESTTNPASTTAPVNPPVLPTQRLPTFTPLAVTPTPLDLTTLELAGQGEGVDEMERRRTILAAVYVEQAILLHYQEAVIALNPAEIGFEIDWEAMQPALESSLASNFNMENLPIMASYSESQLDAYLEDLALRYRVAPRPSFNNSTLVFNLGTMGSEIDINNTKMLIDRALFSPLASERNVTLPVVTVDNHLSDMSVLRQAILEFFATRGVIYNGTDSVISVYVRDLAGGAEMGIHEDALHSGVSTMKIGLLASYFRTLYQEAPPNMKFHMAAAVLCSSNADANALIDQIGGNNIQTGAAFVTDTYCQVGAGNTQVNRHFWIGPAGENGIPTNYYDVVDNGTCPVPETAPIDYSVAVTVDPYLPTTAADMGQMLSSIYQCAADGTGLASTFPGEISPDECNAILAILKGTKFMHLAELGIPEGTPFAHKVGYGGEAVADAGIVFSPNGDYVLSIYIWDKRLGDLDNYALTRWNVIGEVSRIVYNYFNINTPLSNPRLAPNTMGGVACVLPSDGSVIDLSNLDIGRFDASGNPVASACYDWPNCRTFTGWGR